MMRVVKSYSLTRMVINFCLMFRNFLCKPLLIDNRDKSQPDPIVRNQSFQRILSRRLCLRFLFPMLAGVLAFVSPASLPHSTSTHWSFPYNMNLRSITDPDLNQFCYLGGSGAAIIGSFFRLGLFCRSGFLYS